MFCRAVVRCAMLLWVVPVTLAGEPSNPAGLDAAQVVTQVAGGGQPTTTAPAASPFPDFKEVTKDMKSDEGLFTLWYYPAEAKDKDSEKLLGQIPAAFLGKKFMLSTSFSGGGYFTGFPLDERVVQWELLDRQLLLVEPQTRYLIDQAKEVADVVRRTHPDRIRVAVPLVTKSPSGDPVIDLGALLKSEFADISWASFFGRGASGGGINPTLSKWTKRKTFPQNVEIGVELAVPGGSPPGSYDKKLVHYSFWALPQSDYKPRVADDRIGYFLTTNQDWSKPSDARDIFNRHVDRWNLVKRDPTLAVCEPREPIVFYIEKTVPVRFRRAVRDGILEWNKAFEKVGLLNAVEVRQQTDDNEWSKLDPEDMRYSFFRWIVTGGGFAMGPHRANPFTGQIYDADIVFDDSMVRYFEQSAQQNLPATALALKRNDPALHDFLEQFPQWKRPTRDWESLAVGEQDDEVAKLQEALRARMRHRGHQCCEYVEGMKHQMALGRAVLAGQPKEVIDRYLYDVIKEVVMHEVGHTLGLRHNFKASSVYTLAEIQERRKSNEATTGSVMDYNPALFFAKNPTDGFFITPTLGPYDYWAIEYGYRPFDASAKDAEKKGSADQDKKDSVEPGQAGPSKEKKDAPAAKPAGDAAPGGVAQTPPAASAPSAAPATPPTTPLSGEEAMLRGIAARSAEPLLAYGTDEDATFLSPDPRINTFDVGSDPIEWAQARIELVNQRLAAVLDWAVKEQESWYHLRPAFLSLVSEKAFVLDYVGRYIGGQYVNRAHRGDAGAEPPFVLVDPARQRAALAFIEKNLFQDDFLSFPPEVLNHLAPPRWWHEGARVSYTLDFPAHDLISMLQWWNLFDRLFPNTLRRIHDAELKTADADKLTLAEYLQRLQTACWSDAVDGQRARNGQWADGKPFVTDTRRSLQREYLGMMEPLVRYPPGWVMLPDMHAMLRHLLQKLSGQIGEVLAAGKLDFASEAHLQACKTRIDRMLAPELKEYGWSDY